MFRAVGSYLATWNPLALRRRLADAHADVRRLRADADKAVKDYWRLVEAADAAGFDCVRLQIQADHAEGGRE